MEEPRVFVSIYCMVFDHEFSEEMFNKLATGKEIYDFLMKDAGLCMDDNGQLIPGDCNLWYLGCNEKSGCLKYKDKVFQWDFGESSFARLISFIGMIYKDGVFKIFSESLKCSNSKGIIDLLCKYFWVTSASFWKHTTLIHPVFFFDE